MKRLLSAQAFAACFMLMAGDAYAFLGGNNQTNTRPMSSGQAEWLQEFSVGIQTGVAESRLPLLSNEVLNATYAEIARLERIAAEGGWNTVASRTLQKGDSGPEVSLLRRRLMFERDLPVQAGLTTSFDSHVEMAVKNFQRRTGLPQTGIVDEKTRTALNVPTSVRLRQLEVNANRLQNHLRTRQRQGARERHVVVNIPAAIVESVDGNDVVMRHSAGVGRIDRQSPVFDSRIIEINFNPFWTVPVSIIRRDLIPLMREDPQYLTRHRIRIFDRNNNEIPPERINWNSNEATSYRFRQDPGGDINSMGFVRINIPNNHGVFMHDTPQRGIFGESDRFVSSGCVRVQDVARFVEFLLNRNDGWDRARVRDAFNSGERKDVRLSVDVDVQWVYISAWATPDGTIHYRNDIYEKDNIPGLPTTFIDQEETI